MATGDAAALAGMDLVDSATTDARNIGTEINKSRDYIATGAGSTSAATPGKVVQRDVNGRAKVANPSAATDIANKTYVDAKVGTLGTAATYDARTDPDPGTVVLRGDLGRIAVGTPVGDTNAATKKYVDDRDDAKQDSDRNWTLDNFLRLTGGTLSGDLRIPGASAATSGYVIAYINGDGRISKGASSERYKKFISEIDPAALGEVFPDLYRYQMRTGDGSWKFGYIAERMAEHPDTAPFVVYDNQGRPDSIDFIALFMVQLNATHQRQADLEARITALESGGTP